MITIIIVCSIIKNGARFDEILIISSYCSVTISLHKEGAAAAHTINKSVKTLNKLARNVVVAGSCSFDCARFHCLRIGLAPPLPLVADRLKPII